MLRLLKLFCLHSRLMAFIVLIIALSQTGLDLIIRLFTNTLNFQAFGVPTVARIIFLFLLLGLIAFTSLVSFGGRGLISLGCPRKDIKMMYLIFLPVFTLIFTLISLASLDILNIYYLKDGTDLLTNLLTKPDQLFYLFSSLFTFCFLTITYTTFVTTTFMRYKILYVLLFHTGCAVIIGNLVYNNFHGIMSYVQANVGYLPALILPLALFYFLYSYICIQKLEVVR